MRSLNLLFVLMSVLIFCSCGSRVEAENVVSIIPQPVKVEIKTGTWELMPNAVIVYKNDAARSVAQMLAENLRKPTGFSVNVKNAKNGDIRLVLNEVADSLIGDEGYALFVSSNGVEISANKPAGLFYGVQTFMQLFPKEIESKDLLRVKWTIPVVRITDYPRFKWRGLMLDVSRHFFTPEEVEAYIDEMVKAKMNTLHWHLTDDNGWRVEIKSYPKLTEVGAWRVERYGAFGTYRDPQPGEPATYGGFYTQDEIRKIVKYAEERFVTIMPEIDVPGHSMAAIASYPYLCCTQDTSIKVNPGTEFATWYDDGSFKMFIDNTLNPSDERVYEFLDSVYSEVSALFPSEYIHVGGDECYMGYWEENAECQKLMKQLNTDDPLKLSEYLMSRVEKILEKNGKKMIGWDEILEGEIAPSTAVMNWQSIEKAKEAAHCGHSIVMTPTSNCYLDYMQGDPSVEPPVYASLRLKTCYEFNPVPDGVDEKYILGGQGNLWTEQVATLRHAEYMTYPRAWALAEDFWSPDARKDWGDFCQRLENQFERADIAEVKYSKALYDADIKIFQKNGRKWCEIGTEAPELEVYYTMDGGMPDSFSEKYSEAFEIPDGPVTLRVITYRDNKPIGHLITLDPKIIEERIAVN